MDELDVSQKMIADIKKTLSFVFLPNPGGAPIPNGTAFFVAVDSENHTGRAYVYAVTSHHVLRKDEHSYFDQILLRMNKKGGGSDFLVVSLTGSQASPIFTHPDPTVDIALIPIAPDASIYDIKWIPESLLVTQTKFSELNIQEGDDVFFGGLFVPFTGATKNIPIIRFGKVAMISDEKIPWDGEMIDLYLTETQSFGGNSGSPVFFHLNPTRNPGALVLGAPQLFLAGVMKGSFLNANEVVVVNRSPVSISRENAGIAAVVPSYLLHEILYGPNASSHRSNHGG